MFESTLNIQNQLTISWVWKCYSLVKSGSMIRTIRNVMGAGSLNVCQAGARSLPQEPNKGNINAVKHILT